MIENHALPCLGLLVIIFFNFVTDAKSNGFRTIRRKEDDTSGEYEEAEEGREHKNKISIEYEDKHGKNTHKDQDEDENDEED